MKNVFQARVAVAQLFLGQGLQEQPEPQWSTHYRISRFFPEEFHRRTSQEIRRAKAMAASAITSWTLVGPKSGKYSLVGPHLQKRISGTVFVLLAVCVPLNVTGHHLSIQEVDHEKQTFAASVWVSHLAVTCLG